MPFRSPRPENVFLPEKRGEGLVCAELKVYSVKNKRRGGWADPEAGEKQEAHPLALKFLSTCTVETDFKNTS